MTNFFHKLYHPEIFQGHLEKQKYFEGWYFKLVSKDEQQAIAVIPGISLYDATDQHAFIQVIDGIGQQVSYYKFDLSDFKADARALSFHLQNNFFSEKRIELDLPELRGEIVFADTTPIKKSLWSPGIMGWYSFVPKMQCYHGIVSMHHKLTGETTGLLGPINWSNGTGYIEKDWGTSFPKCWIWAHSNNFNTVQKASIMASVAHIPWMGRFFPGFIVVLLLGKEEYRFATYNGSKMKCLISPGEVKMEFKRGDHHLHVVAVKGPSATLRSPISGQMTGKVNESLQARLELTLYKAEQVIWSGTGSSAGLEVAGQTDILETDIWRR